MDIPLVAPPKFGYALELASAAADDPNLERPEDDQRLFSCSRDAWSSKSGRFRGIEKVDMMFPQSLLQQVQIRSFALQSLSFPLMRRLRLCHEQQSTGRSQGQAQRMRWIEDAEDAEK
jgi:hypothetical protein